MSINIIVNKADFQRHLNGCEQRLNALSKSLELTDKFSQKLLLNKTEENQTNYFNQLDVILTQIKYLYSSILTLDQSEFALNGKKRLDHLKKLLEKNRIHFEHIQQYAQIKFDYNYEENQFEHVQEDQQEQLTKLIDKNTNNEQIELERLDHHTVRVTNLEQDISELHGTFIDLNRLIHEQGTIVDNIEQALTNTDEMVQEAAETVQKSVEIKKRSSRIKWFLVALFICSLFLLVMIIYFTLKLADRYG